MPIQIRSIRKLSEDNGIKILTHGPAGAGKTVLAATTGEPTLIIGAESGWLSIRDAPKHIMGVEIETLDDLDEIYNFLVNDQIEAVKEERDPKFSWVALDSISEIAERILGDERINGGNPDPRGAYGSMQIRVDSTLKKYRDLRGYNIYMSCKQQRISDGGKAPYFAPMMPGNKLHQQVPYIFDEVFALRVETDEETGLTYRILQTDRDAAYEAKDRSGVLDLFEEPNLKKIAAKIKEGLAEKQKKASSKKPDEEVLQKEKEKKEIKIDEGDDLETEELPD